jgi:GTP-binding protein Era
MKTGFVGIIGRPNAGKSTLLNSITGQKIAITAEKPQTTRNRVRGVFTERGADGEGVQMIFIDTPGIHKPRNKLGARMTDMALGTLRETDAVLFVADGALAPERRRDQFILERLAAVSAPRIAAINKIDAMPPELFKSAFDAYSGTGLFREVIGISARDGKNVDKLVAALKTFMEDGPAFFPDDMVTDSPERFLAAEFIREKLLMYLEDEIPHGVAVEIESYVEDGDLTRIDAIVYCDKKSHKGIIIGKGGRKLKGVGKSAREEIELLLGSRVFLRIWVKVRENWRDNDRALNELGYNADR